MAVAAKQKTALTRSMLGGKDHWKEIVAQRTSGKRGDKNL